MRCYNQFKKAQIYMEERNVEMNMQMEEKLASSTEG